MKLYPDRLAAHLQTKTAPLYLLHGDEPLQLMELGDAVRAHGTKQGFEERQVLVMVDDTDWGQFRDASNSLSLFAEKRLIEIRMPTGKPGRFGSVVLKEYCENPPADILLLITSGKLDRSATSSAWFKAVDAAGVSIGVYPIPAERLGSWLAERLRRNGLVAEPAAIDLIAERVEGNLLAASQEVERLALLYPEGELTADQVLAAVGDSARYNIADLTLAALQGSGERALRILQGLQEEDTAPTLILWAFAQEIRGGTRAAETHDKGMALDAAMKAAGVWQNRIGPLKLAIERHSVSGWLSMLADTARLDRQIKGQEPGDIWDSFGALCVRLAGDGEPLMKPPLGPAIH